MAKKLKDLTVQELLACAIQSEEEDGRIYADLAQRMRKQQRSRFRPCTTRRTAIG